MQIWLDIYSAAGSLLGGGPLASLTEFNATAVLSAAGSWSATLPAVDTRAASLLQPKRVALAYTWDPDGGTTFLGGGPIEDLRVRISGDNVPMLEVSGGDLLSELAQAVVPYGESSDGEATVRAAMPAGWTIVETDTLTLWKTRYAYESVLAAWVRASEQVGFHFRLAPSGATIRRLEFFDTPASSGVRATLHAQSPAIERNEMLCMIADISERYSSWDIANRAFVFGAGDWEAQLTLAYATEWPDGDPTSGGYTDSNGNTWTISLADSRIDCTSSQSTYGTLPVRVDAKDISPLSNSTADLQAAANALLRAALESMRYRVAPQYAYELEVGALRAPLLPGQTIWVEAKMMIDGERPINIDRELTALEVQSTWDQDGARKDKLTVGTGARLPLSDTGVIVGAIQAAAVMATYPQLSASVDTIAYSEPIDDDAGADFRFWLGNETAIVNQIYLRYRVDPLRSTAKSIGGSVTGEITLAGHTHDVTISSHTHDVPDHVHRVPIASVSAGTGIGARIVQSGSDTYIAGEDLGSTGWDQYVETDPDTGSTTSGSGGSSTPTSASGGGGTFDVDLSSALTLEYGIYEESGGNTYAASDLEWEVNGVPVTETPETLSDGWYALDLTSYVVDSDGLRPSQAANAVSVAIKVASHASKTCQVSAQIERRTVIQAISYV